MMDTYMRGVMVAQAGLHITAVMWIVGNISN